MHTYFKRDMRPGGGLLEDHRKGHAPQQFVGYPARFWRLRRSAPDRISSSSVLSISRIERKSFFIELLHMGDPPVEQRLCPDIATVVDASLYGRRCLLRDAFCRGKGICLPHKRERPGREGKESPVPLFNVCIVEDSVAGFPQIKRSAGLWGSTGSPRARGTCRPLPRAQRLLSMKRASLP